jgi:hypothetical protein
MRLADPSLTPPGDFHVRFPDVTLRAGSLGSLAREVARYKLARHEEPWTIEQVEDCLCRQLVERYPGATNCDSQERPSFPDIDALPRPANRDPDVFGPAGWRLLHTKQITKEKTPETWLNAFHAWIPCPRCRNHFGGLIQESLPNYSSDMAFFACTVIWHNRVNKSIGKRELIWDEAKEIYGK